jgi:hypothetical protein
MHRIIAITLTAALLGGGAAAQVDPTGDEPPEALQEYLDSVEDAHPERISPRLAGTALLINIVYIPARIALTAVVAVLGGLTGFLTFGNHEAADSMFRMVDGPQVITPQMLEGTERWHLGAYD